MTQRRNKSDELLTKRAKQIEEKINMLRICAVGQKTIKCTGCKLKTSKRMQIIFNCTKFYLYCFSAGLDEMSHAMGEDSGQLHLPVLVYAIHML